MRGRLGRVLGLGALVVLPAALACRPLGQGAGAAGAPAAPALGQRTTTTGCVARDARPDPGCTPGAIDPRVTEATLRQTVCARGYTRRVRPPREVTDEIKRRQIRAYGAYAGTDPRAYELDHLVSLELGGAPADEANLWPQARGGAAGAEQKDAVENWLHQEVCAGRLPLAEAQRRIAANWRAVFDALPEAARREVGEGAGEGE